MMSTVSRSNSAQLSNDEFAPVLSLTPYQQMASSLAGALTVSLFMTPLDVVKIRLQAQDSLINKCFLYSNGLMDHLCTRTNGTPKVEVALHTAEEICNCKWYNRPKYFNGTADAFAKIARTEGLSSLWSGLSPTLVLAVPTTVIYFTTYEQLRSRISSAFFTNSITPQGVRVNDIPIWVPLVSGGLARTWAVSIVSPLELIRTKMQSQKMEFFQVRIALRELVKAQGILGLWNGYTATLLRDVPFSALYWPLYEFSKSQLRLGPNNRFLESFVSGAFAGTVACSITLPMDVIKTARQIEMGDKDLMGGKPKSNLTMVKEIVDRRGVRGLFAGLSPRILKVAPACAIMISSYEYCKTFFHHRNIEQGVIIR